MTDGFGDFDWGFGGEADGVGYAPADYGGGTAVLDTIVASGRRIPLTTKRAALRNATLKAFDGTAYTASVQLAGSWRSFIAGIKVARNIPSAEMIVGRSVLVAMFDTSNPRDSVVVGVYT